ncbi:glucose dehydrogenase [FAD, quinone]-like [Planococcus citri]|uniref:glucose dehydrogenase [FAD, quinone]-like n=1 Tax=Planococcus citri TaxID=170843 RepID=UPI0031FA3332
MDSANQTCPTISSSSFVQLVLTQLLTPLITSNCDLTASYPNDKSSNVYQQTFPEYDFIIVGAGSAGCTIANRLSEVKDWKILLIEAGTDPPVNSDIPSLFPTLLQSPFDWNYSTEPAEDSCLGMINNQCKWPRGKALGGSSSINFMLAVRGNAKDYNHWESLGNPGWGYKHVLKYFKKLERVRTPRLDEKLHGYSGNVYLEDFTNNTIYDTKAVKNFIANYSIESGLPIVPDINAHHKAGVAIVPGTLHNMVRWSTAKAYLGPDQRKINLDVMKQTLVTKILIDDKKRAYGIEVLKNGKYKQIFCKKEVIVSAGSINSPQLLMLSGIGPKNHLQNNNIEVIRDLKVGYNLQDHLITYGLVAKLDMKNLTVNVPNDDILYNYLSKRIDVGFVTDTMIFFNTTGYDANYPDIQIHHIVFPQNRTRLPLLSGSNFKPEIVDEFLKLSKQAPMLFMLPTLLRPKSRGRVFLKNNNPSERAKIVTGYLTEKEDVSKVVQAFRTLEKLSQTEAFKKYGKLTYVPLKECAAFIPHSDKHYECLARHLGITVYHAAGTCKMGPLSDPYAVVSSTLKVHGVEGLRVADASIMPHIVSGNTNIPTIMIGEKASDLIKDDWLKWPYVETDQFLISEQAKEFHQHAKFLYPFL